LAENLNYGGYLANLGDEAGGYNQHQSGAQKFCYDNVVSNCDSDGGLYQWQTAMGLAKDCGDGSKTCASQINNGNHQGICPSGWHLPKYEEWYTLAFELNGTSVAGRKMKLISFGGVNSSGFSALGAGSRDRHGIFGNHGSFANFWVADENNAEYGRVSGVEIGRDNLGLGQNSKRVGFSVRCLKN
jgi:uncharacterized protein (TIGR02145 family)